MSCPTCDHTIELVGPCATGEKIYHCPRCGTIRVVYPQPQDDVGDDDDPRRFTYVPKLVERCRIFERDVLVEGKATVEAVSLWYRLGMTESINLPTDRPT